MFVVIFAEFSDFFFQAEDGIRDRSPSRGLGDVYKRQVCKTLKKEGRAFRNIGKQHIYSRLYRLAVLLLLRVTYTEEVISIYFMKAAKQ